MSCISFHYNKNLIFAIVYWILEIIFRMFIHYKSKYFQFAKPDAYNEYIFVILQIIGDLCAGFLVLYIYISLHLFYYFILKYVYQNVMIKL